MRKIFPYLTMGYGYASPAVALEDGPHPGPGTKELRGRPGTRAPHVWLTRDGKQLSTLDLCGRGFVLLAGSQGETWCEAARRAAQSIGIRLDTFRMGVDVVDEKDRWPRAYGVSATGAVLIRPDGIIAWRAKRSAPAAALSELLPRLLSRGQS